MKRQVPAQSGHGRRRLVGGCLTVLVVASALITGSTRAASVSGELAVDSLVANVQGRDADTGDRLDLRTHDFGQRLRVTASGERTSLNVDYHGRETLSGNANNSVLRLFYSAHVAHDFVPDRLRVQVGRFLAPSVILLPVDGAMATLRSGTTTASFFAGRRGILTSRRNVPFDRFLPAAGAIINWQYGWLAAESQVAWSADRAILHKASDETARRFGAWNGALGVVARPTPVLTASARVAYSEQAATTLGPTWRTIDLDTQSLDLFNATASVQWRARPNLRLRYDAHTQRASVYRRGLILRGASGQPNRFLDLPGFEPTFSDHRLRAALRVDHTWLRAETMWRLRPDRRERRIGLGVDADGLLRDWLTFSAHASWDFVDARNGLEARFVSDRRRFSVAAGYRDATLEVEAGAHFASRDAPYSGLTLVGGDPTQPRDADDAFLFVLESQRSAFVRAFFDRGPWFAGIDAELNLHDRGETRIYAQLGRRLETRF